MRKGSTKHGHGGEGCVDEEHCSKVAFYKAFMPKDDHTRYRLPEREIPWV